MTLIHPSPIPDLATLGKVHFIAIGGAGMSGVASAFMARGVNVSGSDQADSETLRALAGEGAEVWVGHDAAHVRGADTVVVSTAIRQDNPELAEARRLGLPVLHRSTALAALMPGSQVVAIAGTHGKTTTTAMCVAALTSAGQDPSYVIGGTSLDSGTGSHMGSSPYFIVEADESDGSFRQYPTRVAVITGIEADHLDNWVTEEAYAHGFEEFATGDEVGLVILDADNPGAQKLGEKLARQGRAVVRYGQGEDCDVRLTRIDAHGGSGQAYVTMRPLAGTTMTQWSGLLKVCLPGLHNLYNAAAALCVTAALGLDPVTALKGLESFHGTARRFQRIGEARGVLVVDDYAHHPTEVAATIEAAREVAGTGRVIVCFQPHLFTRTRDFADDFGTALAMADEAVVVDIYPAREDPIPGVTGELVADAVAAHGGHVRYVPDMADATDVLVSLARPSDVVLTVGAGSVTTLAPIVLAGLEG